MLLESLESNRYRRLFFVFLFRDLAKSRIRTFYYLPSFFCLWTEIFGEFGIIWKILFSENRTFLNTNTSLVSRFSSIFFTIFGSSRPLRYTVNQLLCNLLCNDFALRHLLSDAIEEPGACLSFTLIHERDPVICYSSRDVKRSIQSERFIPKTIIYFTKLVFLVSICEAHCKRCEISWRIISVCPCKWGEPGRDGEIRGEPREIQRSFLVKKLVSEACHVVARCSQHPLPMMVACSTHDEAFIKNYSRVFAGKTRRSVESNRLILSRTRYRCDSIGRMELFRYDWTRNGVRRVPWKLSAVHEQRRRHGRTP